MTKISTKNYDFSFQPNLVEMKLNPSLKTSIITFIGVFIIFLPFAILSIMLISVEVNFHSIVFLGLSIIIYVFDIIGTWIKISRIKNFKIILNSEGIYNFEVNGKYFIHWEDVASYGIVNDNVISGAHARPLSPRQTCFYFSKNIHTENSLRRKFDRITGGLYNHCNSNHMIVITIEDDNAQQAIISNIKKITNKYCKCKEISYIS